MISELTHADVVLDRILRVLGLKNSFAMRIDAKNLNNIDGMKSLKLGFYMVKFMRK